MTQDHLTYRVTFEDCFALSGQIEQEYEVAVTWRTSAHCRQQKWSYAVQLTAWRIDASGRLKAVCSEYVSYPNRYHGSMPGAVLDGLMKLNDRLDAQRALEALPVDPSA